jgi:hypothetical protein
VADRFDERPGERSPDARDAADDLDGANGPGGTAGTTDIADTSHIGDTSDIDLDSTDDIDIDAGAKADDADLARSVAASLSTPPPAPDDWSPPRWADVDGPGRLAAPAAEGAHGGRPAGADRTSAVATLDGPRARPAVRSGTLAFGVAFVLLGILGLLEPLDVDLEAAWLWAAAPVALGLATMIAVIRRALATNG